MKCSRSSIIVMIALAAMLYTGLGAHAQGNTITVGLLFGDGYSQDAQLKKMVSDVITNVAKSNGMGVSMKWYTNENEFFSGVKKNAFDIVYSNEHDTLSWLIRTQKYNPAVTISMFGYRDNPICLFVPRSNALKTSADLRGFSISTYYSREGYLNLRQFLGKKPETYFSRVVPQHKGKDALKMLVDGKVDASFVLRSNYEMLKVGNPSDAVKVVPIGCTKNYYDLPIMYSNTFPLALAAQFRERLKSVFSDPNMKQYRGLANLIKLKMIDVNASDYNTIVNLYMTANKKGWEKDYTAWYTSVPKTEAAYEVSEK